jgi:transcription initiation factor IIE alpha subunit
MTQLIDHLRMLSKHFPLYSGVITDAIAEVEDLETIRSGTPAARVFKAIDRGFAQEREIARVTGLQLPDVRRILRLAREEKLLQTEAQGGKTEGARGARKQLHQRSPLAMTAK